MSHKLRSLLTTLGIIFGVAAVIAMMAIGNGAQQEILDQLKLVGVNNIVVTPIVEQTEEEIDESGASESGNGEKLISPGLSLADARSIASIIPGIKSISPEIEIETSIIKDARRRSAKLVGVENNYFTISNFELDEGNLFNAKHLEMGESVCVIGKGIKTKFFSQENPIGKNLKVGSHWLRVIGVLKERYVSPKSISNLGIRDYNMDVYAPVNTVLRRYKNRALVNQYLIQQERWDRDKKMENYHQLDRLVVQVEQTESLNATTQVINKMLKRRHRETVDYEVTIPELLLKQQQRTKSIFNFVLGAIAGISLIVGGIGIMNIMLASVLERIKEIGLRQSLGATRLDIVLQFMIEAVTISVTGGVLGIILGITITFVISTLADIPTIISFFSIFLSFAVAASIGLIFGITPARKASMQDPISSLRYE